MPLIKRVWWGGDAYRQLRSRTTPAEPAAAKSIDRRQSPRSVSLRSNSPRSGVRTKLGARRIYSNALSWRGRLETGGTRLQLGRTVAPASAGVDHWITGRQAAACRARSAAESFSPDLFSPHLDRDYWRNRRCP